MAIGKHIIAQEALAGGGVGVGIEESAQFRIVISGLQIVELSLSVVYVATTSPCASTMDMTSPCRLVM